MDDKTGTLCRMVPMQPPRNEEMDIARLIVPNSPYTSPPVDEEMGILCTDSPNTSPHRDEEMGILCTCSPNTSPPRDDEIHILHGTVSIHTSPSEAEEMDSSHQAC